jgi:hypothetical protein
MKMTRSGYVLVAVVAAVFAWPSIKSAAIQKMTRDELTKRYGVGAVLAAPLVDPMMTGAWDTIPLYQQVVVATCVLVVGMENCKRAGAAAAQ